jgi:hypothetical protein
MDAWEITNEEVVRLFKHRAHKSESSQVLIFARQHSTHKPFLFLSLTQSPRSPRNL